MNRLSIILAGTNKTDACAPVFFLQTGIQFIQISFCFSLQPDRTEPCLESPKHYQVNQEFWSIPWME